MKTTPTDRQTDLLEAEARGIVAGALAAGETPEAAFRLGETSVANERPVLDDEVAKPAALLAALEDEAVPLGLRVDRTGAWTRGFLSGLGQAGERLLALGAEGEDILRNLESISHGAEIAGEPQAPAAGEDDEALRVLLDYLRFAIDFFRARLV